MRTDASQVDAGWVSLRVDGQPISGREGEPLLECLDRHGLYLPHLCYHPGLGPLQTCDTCLVNNHGRLRHGCSLRVAPDMEIRLLGGEPEGARGEAIDRIVAKHELYCTVCENNNGDCEVHDTVRDMGVTGQRYAFTPKPC